MAGNASAQIIPPEVGRGIASLKPKIFALSVEKRFFVPNINARAKSNEVYFQRRETPEFIFKYKNFSLDYIRAHDDISFLKLKVDKKIFSLMGTRLEWNVALNGFDWRNGSASNKNYSAVLPSIGINLHMRVRPRVDIYCQFSGLSFGERGYFKDFESGIKYSPQKNFSINAGWRRIDFKLRRGGEVGDFALNGPFAGLHYDF